MRTNEHKATIEQQNAAFWAARAAAYVSDYATAAARGSNLTGYFRGHALAAQEYAAHSHAMARYWLDGGAFPSIL